MEAFEERKRTIEEFQNNISQRYLEMVDQPKRDKMMEEALKMVKDQKELQEKVRLTQERDLKTRRMMQEQHAMTLEAQVRQHLNSKKPHWAAAKEVDSAVLEQRAVNYYKVQLEEDQARKKEM